MAQAGLCFAWKRLGVSVACPLAKQTGFSVWYREARLVVFGHSHRPEVGWTGGCLVLNPGAAGRRRFQLPLTMARITVRERRLIPEILALE